MGTEERVIAVEEEGEAVKAAEAGPYCPSFWNCCNWQGEGVRPTVQAVEVVNYSVGIEYAHS